MGKRRRLAMQNAEATRERILDAALAEFATYGVAGARVDRIAKTAGCNKNLIYIYFENKETLFTTVLQKHLSQVYEDLPFTPADLPGFAARVFDFTEEHPDIMRLLAWSTLEQTAVSPNRSTTHDAKIAAVEKEQKEGTVSTQFSAPFLMMSVMALASAWSAALPYGSALDPHPSPAVSELRDSISRTVALLVNTPPKH
jgi:AcrR family transcriptional regulator